MFLLLLLLLLPSLPLAAKNRAKTKDVEIVVVIPSYNNERYVKKNLKSLLKQDYKKWQMIYIDDASNDRTCAFVERFVRKHHLQKRSRIIHNHQRMKAMANIYNAVHMVDRRKVIVLLDGDDKIHGSHALSRVAHIYRNKKVWLTYGNYKARPKKNWTNDPCHAFPRKVIKEVGFRNYEWVCYPLRTFYAGLFHRIKREDLMWKGSFFPVVSDTGYMFPMLEMAARGHIHFIKKIQYVYHVDSPINDFRKDLPLMQEVAGYIRNLPKYKPLDRLFDEDIYY